MSRHGIAIAAALAAAVTAGCERTAPRSPESRPAPPATAAPPADLRAAMQAKLAHSHALLDAVALEDFARAEEHGRALLALSEDASWWLQTTDPYVTLTRRFQAEATTLADAAAAADGPAVSAAYDRLTASCRACHAYLRHEGIYQLPQRVMRPGRRPERPA